MHAMKIICAFKAYVFVFFKVNLAISQNLQNTEIISLINLEKDV